VLNFKEAPLEEVLNYLSEAAGFVVVQQTPVSGTVNIISHSPLSKDEVIDVLNAALVEKGYTAIRMGRILKIVERSKAAQYPLPVQTGSDPDKILPRDEVVTQILPIRYLDAAKVVETLSPLLGPDAKLSANADSNALIMTDTLVNIRRIATIIQALDTSVASISTIRVFPLQYADATQLAQIINQLFQQQSNASSRRGAPPILPFMRFGRGGSRGGNSSNAASSPARAAASRVTAVADDRTNSLVVSAPEDLMSTIETLVKQIDTAATEPTEIRIFPLQNADAMETADLLTQLFTELNSGTAQQSRFGRFPQMIFPRPGRTSNQTSARAQQQAQVVVVGDPRTNSLIVSASHDTMLQLAEVIGRLDADTSRNQRVYVYSLKHADPEAVAEILRNTFEEGTTGSRSRSSIRRGRGAAGTSVLRSRQSSGATFNPSFGSGTSSRRPSR